MILDNVKVALRTTTTDPNLVSQIQSLIDACIEDLKSADIKVTEDVEGNYSPLITNAVCSYVKAYFINSADSEMYLRSYHSMKSQLALLKEYQNV